MEYKKEIQINKQKYIEKLQSRPIVIFTASEGGRRVLEFLKSLNIVPDYFCDNVKEKQNEKFHGIDVISPEKIINIYGVNGVNIFIASISFVTEIYNQVIELGFDENNIFSPSYYIESQTGKKLFPIKLHDEMLKNVRSVELEMLKILHKICEKHNIKYYIMFGTLLGAVRHKGYIPWDDDTDVAMMRDDYNRFLEVCKTELPQEYFLQTPETDPQTHVLFAKIRKNDTLYEQLSISGRGCHKGIWLDIYPFDNVPKIDSFFIKIQDYLYRKMRRYYVIKTNIIDKKFKNSIWGLLTLPFKPITLYKVAFKVVSFYNDRDTEYITEFTLEKDLRKKTTFRKKDFGDGCLLKFEDSEFYAPINYKKVLKEYYGDYMKIPPVEERENKHRIIKCNLNTKDEV